MCDGLTLLQVLSKTGTVLTQPANGGKVRNSEIQTTTAGGLWGAYLMTLAHFCKELASSKLAIS